MSYFTKLNILICIYLSIFNVSLLVIVNNIFVYLNRWLSIYLIIYLDKFFDLHFNFFI